MTTQLVNSLDGNSDTKRSVFKLYLDNLTYCWVREGFDPDLPTVSRKFLLQGPILKDGHEYSPAFGPNVFD